MAKTIKISDLTAQMAQMQEMADELDEAIQLIIKSIESMRNAGIDSISPLATAKLGELLTVAKTQKENLELGVKVLQESVNSMQNVDASLRKMYSDGNLSGFGYPVSTAVQWTGTSNQEVVDDRVEADPVTAKIDALSSGNVSGKEQLAQGGTGYMNYMNQKIDSYEGYPVGGTQCYAMAHILQVELYGKGGGPAEYRDHFDVGEIKAGDIIGYSYWENGQYSANPHYVLVTKVNTDGTLTVSEGNYAGGQMNYNRTLTVGGEGGVANIWYRRSLP